MATHSYCCRCRRLSSGHSCVASSVTSQDTDRSQDVQNEDGKEDQPVPSHG